MEDLFLTMDKEDLIKLIKKQNEQYKELKSAVEKFVEKNFKGGSKADREDYAQMVSCKDIWDLRELIKEK